LEYKKLHLRIPKPIWEQLYHIFPERGGINSIIIQFFKLVIELGRGNRFIEKIRERIEEEDG
jgi:hypothetical protein